MKKVNDINMYYEVHGKGFPFILIMGLGANSNWWPLKMVENYAKHFKVIIFDNRGSGRSDISEKQYTVKLFADDTVGLMDALDIEKAHIFGISLGGMIAQEIVINYPERVEKLVLGCTTCGGYKQVPGAQEVVEKSIRSTKNISQEQLMEEFVEQSIDIMFTKKFINENPDFIKNRKSVFFKYPISPDAYDRTVEAVINFKSFRRLKNVKAPTLIVQGKEDPMALQENADILGELIPNSKVVLFDGVAHGFHEQELEKVFNCILKFLQAPLKKQIEAVI